MKYQGPHTITRYFGTLDHPEILIGSVFERGRTQDSIDVPTKKPIHATPEPHQLPSRL